MRLFRDLVLAAAVAGCVAGIAVTGVQRVAAVPLILAAEGVEAAASPAEPAVHDHEGPAVVGHAHGAEADAWAPANGLERTVSTLVANVVAQVGFALVLGAAMVLSGRALGWRRGLLWGAAAFLAVAAAPALRLPPELPGLPVAELGPRQLLWVAVVAGNAAGLALVAFGRSLWRKLLGVACLVAPYALAVPAAPEVAVALPVELNRRFVVAVLLGGLAGWLLLGGLLGWLLGRSAVAAAPAGGDRLL